MARIALVTGGDRGIGAATCKALKVAGYTVAANYSANTAAADRFRSETGIPTYKWDVADFDACQGGVETVTKELGPIDILVNNAGITRDSTLHKMTKEQWRSVIDVDLSGCFNMCRAVIEGMRERRFGRIISVSSINGMAGQFGQTNYAAARQGSSVSPSRWRWRARDATSPLTWLPRATPTRTWWPPCPQMYSNRSWHPCPSAASASPKRLPAASCSWPAKMRVTSPASRSRSTAGNTWRSVAKQEPRLPQIAGML